MRRPGRSRRALWGPHFFRTGGGTAPLTAIKAAQTARFDNRHSYLMEGSVVRLAIIHAVVLLVLTLIGVGTAGAAEPDGSRRQALVAMVRQDCGSCHGLTLKGGLGPALLPEALAGKSAGSLIATVLSGRPGTAMPGWSRFVSEAEAAWIVDQLLRGFPPVDAGGRR